MAAQRRRKQKPAVAAGPVEIPDADHEVVIERAAAIDVAKATGTVCVRLPGKSGRRFSRVWEVSARTGVIGELAQQLIELDVEKVTVESTSDYWRIWYYLLEAAGLDVQLVNARGVRTCRAGKTDLLTELPASVGAGACRERAGLARFAARDQRWGCAAGVVAVLVVPLRGALEATGDLFQPYRLVDADGAVVAPVAAFFAELTACGRPATTQRSYGMDLLRWFRFLWALGVGWDQATRVEARDFCRWLQIADKPVRPHWRYPTVMVRRGAVRTGPGVNAVTGKAFAVAGMRRRRWRIARPCCVGSTTSTWRRAPGRWSTRSRCRGIAVPAGWMLITTRWSRSPGIAAAGIGRRWWTGRRGVSRTSGSTSCSRSWVRIVTGRWSRSGSRPGRGRRSCWAPRSPTSTRDSS